MNCVFGDVLVVVEFTVSSTREIKSPRVGVVVGVACAVVHGVARALLPHSPAHTHTVRLTTVGWRPG